MNRDFRDLIVELQSADARFLVVGAYALGAHGIPRATADFDIWIDASAENATRVMRALARFGVALDALGIRASDLVDPDMVVHFGVPPYRIDIMSAIDGVEFADAWQRRIMERFQDPGAVHRAAGPDGEQARGRPTEGPGGSRELAGARRAGMTVATVGRALVRYE